MEAHAGWVEERINVREVLYVTNVVDLIVEAGSFRCFQHDESFLEVGGFLAESGIDHGD